MRISLHSNTRGETRTRNLLLRRKVRHVIDHAAGLYTRLTNMSTDSLVTHSPGCSIISTSARTVYAASCAPRACDPGSTPGVRICPTQVRVLPGSYQMTHPACAKLGYHSRRSRHRACVRGGHPTGCCDCFEHVHARHRPATDEGTLHGPESCIRQRALDKQQRQEGPNPGPRAPEARVIPPDQAANW